MTISQIKEKIQREITFCILKINQCMNEEGRSFFTGKKAACEEILNLLNELEVKK